MAIVSALDGLQEEHILLSRSRCSCGWEGGSFTIHIFDVLGLTETPESKGNEMVKYETPWLPRP